jgi:hypothetical protein
LQGRALAEIGAEQAAELRKRAAAGYMDFAGLWAERAPMMAFRSAFWNALYLMEECAYYCMCADGTDAERATLVAKVAADFGTVVAGLAGGMDSSSEARSAAGAEGVQARAGKKISSARMEKIKKVRAYAADAVSELDALITEVEGETDDEAEGTTAQMSAPPAPAPTPEAVQKSETPTSAAVDAAPRGDMPAPSTTPDPFDALRKEFDARVGVLEKRLETQTADAAKAKADAEAELTKARTALTEATAARDTAQKRVTELEKSRPPSRGREPEEGDGESAGAVPEQRTEKNWGRGALFGRKGLPIGRPGAQDAPENED